MSNETNSAVSNSINLSLNITAINSVTIIKKTDYSYTVECRNLDNKEQQVSCPIQDASHRDLYSVTNVSFAFENLALTGTIDLSTTANYTIKRSDLGLPPQENSTNPTLPGNTSLSAQDRQKIQEESNKHQSQGNQDPEISIDVHAIWNFVGNVLKNLTLTSSKISSGANFGFNLAAQSCINAHVTDSVYQLKLLYNGTIPIVGNTTGTIDAQNTTSNETGTNETTTGSIGGSGSLVTVEVIANMILSKITTVTPFECNAQTSAPTLPPEVPGVAIYGILTTKDGQNAIGKYYGFNKDIMNTIFYNDVDKYALVTSDSCFKIRIWIVIPFLIPIIFPLWIDASIITSVLGAFEDVLSQASGILSKALDIARELRSKVSVKNALELGMRAKAVAKGAATEDGLRRLAEALQKYAEKQLEYLQVAKKLKDALALLAEVEKIIDRYNEFIETVSSFQTTISELNGNGLTAKQLLETLLPKAETIVRSFHAFSNIIDSAPESAAKERITSAIRNTVELFELFPEIAKKKAKEVDKANPVKVAIGVLEVFINMEVLTKIFLILQNLDIVELILAEARRLVDHYIVILNEIKQTLGDLEEIGNKQGKSALEKELEALAEASAAEFNNVAGTVSELFKLNQAEDIANAALDAAVGGVTAAADALGSAAEGIEARKRDEIRRMITSYFIDTLDLYKITRLGRFDENNLHERQILVNDLSGTRIYARNGTLLWQRKDFCKHPFVSLGRTRLDTHGCDGSSNPCDVGGYNCQERGYWYDAFQYRVSFDFYNNHDLSKGGVLVGDFDGDGTDDIMCHYPGSTKNYDKITKDKDQRATDDKSEIVENNEIIYSPLKAKTSTGRFDSKEQVLPIINTNTSLPERQKDWCKDGVIRVGDFNGDARDDMLCITQQANYLLYSNGYTFRFAGNTTDGVVTLLSGTTSPNHHAFIMQSESNALYAATVVPADVDGDKYSDLVVITNNNADIYYGHAQEIFVRNTTKTKAWIDIYKAKFASCYTYGFNHVVVGDTNNDGKDDIACVSLDNTNIDTIQSTITGTTNKVSIQPQAKSHLQIFINDVTLHPYQSEQENTVRERIRKDIKTHSNIHPTDSLLISSVLPPYNSTRFKLVV